MGGGSSLSERLPCLETPDEMSEPGIDDEKEL
jgi:hypothetical protein